MTEINISGSVKNIVFGYIGDPDSPTQRWEISADGGGKHTLYVNGKIHLPYATIKECLIAVAHLDEI